MAQVDATGSAQLRHVVSCNRWPTFGESL